jgi:hypothetical protein
MPRKTVAGLEAEMSRDKRKLSALQEWFFLEGREEPVVETAVLPSGEEYRLAARGLLRSQGGVVVIDSGPRGVRMYPEHLDDLRARVARDGYEQPFLRAVESLVKRRDELLSAAGLGLTADMA